MKRVLAIVLVALLMMSMFAGCGKKDDYLVEKGKLIMATNAAFPPYESTDDNGKFIGIDIEIAQAIADKLDLELVINNMEFTAALEAAQQGKADMVMAGVTVTADREMVMEFSKTYATGIQVVIVPENSSIKTIDDLEGKKIGTQMGTTGYLFCSDTPANGGYGEENVVAYDTGITAVQALLNNQIDCIVIDNAPAQAFVQENSGLKILDTEYAIEDYAIGFAKGNTKLRDMVNEALDELIEDGTVQKIIDKYIPAQQN